MALKEKLLATAVIVAISIASSVAYALPDYIRKEPTKKVIEADHYWEFHPDTNPNKYGWCGHTALQSAMSAFYPKDATGVRIGLPSLNDIHNQFLKLDPNGQRYGYKEVNRECQGYGYCPELNLLKEGATKFGFSTNRYNAYTETELFNGLKSIIDSGATAVVLSRTYTRNVAGTTWGNIGHFYAVHGYRTENGKSYLYVRDPVFEYGGGATDIHEIPMTTWWNQMKIKRNNGYYVGYFSLKK